MVWTQFCIQFSRFVQFFIELSTFRYLPKLKDQIANEQEMIMEYLSARHQMEHPAAVRKLIMNYDQFFQYFLIKTNKIESISLIFTNFHRKCFVFFRWNQCPRTSAWKSSQPSRRSGKTSTKNTSNYLNLFPLNLINYFCIFRAGIWIRTSLVKEYRKM